MVVVSNALKVYGRKKRKPLKKVVFALRGVKVRIEKWSFRKILFFVPPPPPDSFDVSNSDASVSYV